ncbi:hypothetical protein [Nonomuraea rubra]|uniref:hypothetical protein n=1 Tax=Nonomuraea rubra TaxID=46180 RepID=UPI0034059C17
MRFRPAVEDDLDRLLGCVVDDHISWSHPDRLLSFLESGRSSGPGTEISRQG